MPIVKTYAKPNGAVLQYHVVTRAYVLYPDSCMVDVCSWPDAASHDAGNAYDWTQPVQIPLARVLDPEQAIVELAGGAFEGGTVVADVTDPLEQAKTRKKAALDDEREQRGAAPIAYADATFDADATALRNVEGWQLQLARGLDLPEGFVWRDFTNVDHPADAAFLDGLGQAITLRGTVLYQQAWTLKAAVDAATTVEEVEAVSWADIS